MHFNFPKTETLTVMVRGYSYPVEKIGQGIPCLMICLGSPSLRTVSPKFFDLFETYSCDMYWVKEAEYQDESLNLDIILDDIKALIDVLKLDKCVLFAHSAYGIIALEFAKKYPNAIKGIIMIGTPVNCNALVAEKNKKIFEREASLTRKAIDAQNRERFQAADKQFFTPEQLFLQEYIYRDAARYWHDPAFDCSKLWEGIALGQRLIDLFTNVLPEIDVLNHLNEIKIPIFLAVGLADFDCCPWEWEEVENLPKLFKIIRFKYSGHWPHYEESERFNRVISAWINDEMI